MSSEHDVVVVTIDEIVKHPNADTLSVTQVDGRPVLFRTGEFATGDRAVYLPIDTLVPVADERFAFLAARSVNGGGYHRLRAIKLRGVFSMGLLVKADPSWPIGGLVHDVLGTKVYDPEAASGAAGRIRLNTPCEPDPGYMAPYTDIESLRKFRWAFAPDTEVVATEKIHGANARYTYRDGRFWCGSRRTIKADTPDDIWWRALRETPGLMDMLRSCAGCTFYGEVYGRVQDLAYDAPGSIKFVAFDAMSFAGWCDWGDLVMTCGMHGVPVAPVLYRGPFSGLDDALANGPTVLGQGHCREGFVVRPVTHKWDPVMGRVIAKLVGEDYHLRKEG